MKQVIITVEITVNVVDNVDSKNVVVEIDKLRTFPVIEGNKAVGRTESYKTINCREVEA